MFLQASIAASQYLPIRDCLFVDPQWRGGLETAYYSEADPVRNTEIAQGRAQHLESGSTGTTKFIQGKQIGVYQKSKGICFIDQEEAYTGKMIKNWLSS